MIAQSSSCESTSGKGVMVATGSRIMCGEADEADETLKKFNRRLSTVAT